MTIITQSLSDKKLAGSQLKQPLVDNLVNDGKATPTDQRDSEAGPGPSPLVVTMMRARAARVANLTTVCVVITALLVLTTGIVGGVYIYRQFAYYRQLKHFRGWCSIPYGNSPDELSDPNWPRTGQESAFAPLSSPESDSRRQNSNDDSSSSFDDVMANLVDEMKKLEKSLAGSTADNNNDDPVMQRFNKFFDEQFDLDTENGEYEQIEVPDFSRGRRGRFIHDFAKNKTGIIDMEEGRCFVMPLNRTLVLPPKSLFDLIVKMRQGYYDIDTSIVRQKYRVVLPAVDDLEGLGNYIGRECAKMPTYRLEPFINSVYKRSVDHNPIFFSEFAGNKISEIEIVNVEDAKGRK